MLKPRLAKRPEIAGEHAGLVLDEHREDVLHDFFLPAAEPPIISVIEEPAGTIGYTLSSWRTRKSITAGRLSLMAARSASATWSLS